MATFDLSNAAGAGFNMSTTGDSGWSYVEADPSVTTELYSDDGRLATFVVHGNPQFDFYGVTYYLGAPHIDGNQDIGVDNMYYYNHGVAVLSITNLNLQTTAYDLQGGAWEVRLNNGDDQFFGNDYNDVIRGGFGNDLVVGYLGNDTLLGDQGNDILGGGGGNDVIIGGDGYDTASYGGLSTNYSFFLNADGSIQVTDRTGGWGTDIVAGVEAFYFDNGTFSLAELLPPPSAPVLPPFDPFTGDNANNALFGNSGNNTLKGLGGSDHIYGSAGADKIYGGLGNDVLSGGSGKDTFVFDTKPDQSRNHDTIVDFRAVDDTIYIDNAIFKKIGANGALKSTAFWANATGKAHDGNDRIIYEKDTGKLFYDADGTGSGKSVLFATISKHPAITFKDFYVL
jgi:serralysin